MKTPILLIPVLLFALLSAGCADYGKIYDVTAQLAPSARSGEDVELRQDVLLYDLGRYHPYWSIDHVLVYPYTDELARSLPRYGHRQVVQIPQGTRVRLKGVYMEHAIHHGRLPDWWHVYAIIDIERVSGNVTAIVDLADPDYLTGQYPGVFKGTIRPPPWQSVTDAPRISVDLPRGKPDVTWRWRKQIGG